MELYKLQWIDSDGLHMLESKDYNALWAVYEAFRNQGKENEWQVELWDMTLNSPVRVI